MAAYGSSYCTYRDIASDRWQPGRKAGACSTTVYMYMYTITASDKVAYSVPSGTDLLLNTVTQLEASAEPQLRAS